MPSWKGLVGRSELKVQFNHRTEKRMDRRHLDPLGSRASSCYSSSWSDHDVDMHRPHTPSDEDWDEGDTFISFTTTETKCEELYEEGLQYKLKGELDQAVPCFLKCLEGMQECQYFAKLPQTLHVLAELYQSLNCYDKAVEFAQAEKLFYEAVLLDSTKSQTSGEKKARPKRKPFSKKPKEQSWRRGSNPAEYGDLLIKKANEYSHLAKLCAEQKKYELALDYCGKAAKIRKSVFGEGHPITKETLDYLTVLYAEVGRADYMNALHIARSTENEAQRGGPSHLKADQSLTSEGVNCSETEQCCREKGCINVEVLGRCTEASATNSSSNELSVDMDNRTNGHGVCGHKDSESTAKEATLQTVEEEEVEHNSKLTLNACEQTDPSVDQAGKEASCTQVSRQEVCSQLMSSSSECKEGAQNSPHLLDSLHGSHQETNGMQVNKCDLSDAPAKNVQGSWHSHELNGKSELSNEALHGDTPPPLPHKKQESIYEPIRAHKTATVITDVLSKAPGCVYVAVPEQGIEHARCLPLWVLVLGAFVEMAILAYVFFTHR